MEKVNVTKEGEPYVQQGFDLPLAFKEFVPAYGDSRVRLGGRPFRNWRCRFADSPR
jgi:hypothetical protein